MYESSYSDAEYAEEAIGDTSLGIIVAESSSASNPPHEEGLLVPVGTATPQQENLPNRQSSNSSS
jgi:hypothetical protein